MKNGIFIAVLVIALAACAPAATTATADIKGTAVSAAWTGVALTPNSPPSATLPLQTFTPTATYVSPTPSPIPTLPPPPIFTPDAIQVERWKEYQTELAKALFTYNPAIPQVIFEPEEYKDALCEWDILGRSGQEVYVWAECGSTDGLRGMSNPVAIYLEPDGSIREVNVPSEEIDSNTQLPIYDLHLFPIDVQEKLCLYYFRLSGNCRD